MLDITKAEKELDWRPVWSADTAVRKTVEWYRRFYAGEEMTDFTLLQINDYQERAES